MSQSAVAFRARKYLSQRFYGGLEQSLSGFPQSLMGKTGSMRRVQIFHIVLVLGIFLTSQVNAQIRYLAEDTVIFSRFLQYSRQGDHSMIHTALFFIDTPYTSGSLEGDSEERLRVNLHELDCVTFVENVIALHLMLQSDRHTFDNFCRILQHIRYRNGIIDGYLSRLHYFSEWLGNNVQKEIINLPAVPGCHNYTPGVSYMSTHCDAYPALKTNPEWCRQMSVIEKSVNELNFCYIPKEQVKDSETILKNGDIIAITTQTNGLDIAHTGLALVQNGSVYLLHASSEAKKVVVSEETLHDYLARLRNHSGIIPGRLVD